MTRRHTWYICMVFSVCVYIYIYTYVHIERVLLLSKRRKSLYHKIDFKRQLETLGPPVGCHTFLKLVLTASPADSAIQQDSTRDRCRASRSEHLYDTLFFREPSKKPTANAVAQKR